MKIASLVGVLLPLTFSSAFAAPFCLTKPNMTPQCVYYDGVACAQQALHQNGACEPNSAEITMPKAKYGGNFLVLPIGGPTGQEYADGQVCSAAALAQHGICARAADVDPTPDRPDAYHPVAHQ